MRVRSYLRKRSQPYKTLAYHRFYIPLLCRYVSFAEKQSAINDKVSSLPPPSLRYRVGGRPERKVFLNTGRQISEDIENSLEKASLKLDSFGSVLDFGCGCGRTLIWFANRKPTFYGTDIDAESITWCRNNLKFGKFDVNDPLPPLIYQDGKFDFIYLISVFTHLNEEFQFKWMDELNRILREGGIILATFHAKGSWKDLLPEDIAELQSKGFIYRVRNDRRGVLPGWYQTAYHTKQYVVDTFSKRFKLLTYIERGVKNFQDVAVMQKK
jgi:SAM-dependent methyltransferase